VRERERENNGDAWEVECGGANCGSPMRRDADDGKSLLHIDGRQEGVALPFAEELSREKT
jgi:hypothetical protein